MDNIIILSAVCNMLQFFKNENLKKKNLKQKQSQEQIDSHNQINKQLLLMNSDFFDSLSKYHLISPYKITEGYSEDNSEGSKLLKRLVKNNQIVSVLEIGFNGGHSSEIFLKENLNTNVISFDISKHDYVKIGKEYIDIKYPNRHTLILGNSLETIPKYYKNNPNKKYDIIFIDGGHDYEIAISDLKNCKSLAHKNTIVIMDDTIYSKKWIKRWTIGPTKAWLDGINKNIIKEISHEEYDIGKGASWGKYIID